MVDLRVFRARTLPSAAPLARRSATNVVVHGGEPIDAPRAWVYRDRLQLRPGEVMPWLRNRRIVPALPGADGDDAVIAAHGGQRYENAVRAQAGQELLAEIDSAAHVVDLQAGRVEMFQRSVRLPGAGLGVGVDPRRQRCWWCQPCG
jgi:hypothetical protein